MGGNTSRFDFFLLLGLVRDVFRFRVVELLFVFVEERHADGGYQSKYPDEPRCLRRLGRWVPLLFNLVPVPLNMADPTVQGARHGSSWR